ISRAAKWLAPGTISLRSPGGRAQLRWDSSGTAPDSAHASELLRRELGDTSVGANCLRAVTTSPTLPPPLPPSRRRGATSAPGCCPWTDWLRASRYSVVLRHSESALCGDNTEANHRIQANFMTNSLLRCAGRFRPRWSAQTWNIADMAYWGGCGSLARF